MRQSARTISARDVYGYEGTAWLGGGQGWRLMPLVVVTWPQGGGWEAAPKLRAPPHLGAVVADGGVPGRMTRTRVVKWDAAPGAALPTGPGRGAAAPTRLVGWDAAPCRLRRWLGRLRPVV
jgi:hypothetical protein